MRTRLSKLKNYEVHSVTSAHDGAINANIATWVMQSGLGGTHLTVALDAGDYTHELVHASGRCNVHLLGEGQIRYVRNLGRRSGRDHAKLRRIPHQLDAYGVPILTEALGYFECSVEGWIPSGDHNLAVCRIVRMVNLDREQTVLRLDTLRERKIVRS